MFSSYMERSVKYIKLDVITCVDEFVSGLITGFKRLKRVNDRYLYWQSESITCHSVNVVINLNKS